MTVDGRTALTGIVGYPVSHSLSPLMHNAAFGELGLNMVYLPFSVAPEALPQGVAGLAALGVRGFNVTIPHKVAILPLLHEITPEARAIGAVNTVLNRDGLLTGYNTDGIGLLRALEGEFGFYPAGRSVLLLGAGGAARSAVAALSLAGAARVVVANRTKERGEELVASVAPHLPGTLLQSAPFTLLSDAGFLSGFDLLVNTTSVGMGGSAFGDLALTGLPPHAAIYDMVYAPLETPLMEQGRGVGLPVANGIGMLVAQGEAAFTIWTGQQPPAGCMKRAVLEGIGAATLDIVRQSK
ncbi:shikimate dehydrogenase [Geomonas sp. RF6]|uniref:shikimate dehydrogenase n=1 Tax=Geomonas sp. RF6 TaxID=2897342 RepID=UPI001E5628BA|nr:shikimate dehydrogenase [Geomonas sp. RF6]UFS72845.1 shikimate dehydrogenase [Geomonas sp. RF6]